MEDTRINFETAKLAKEKGFPQEPNRRKVPYYNSGKCSAQQK